uniref:Ribosomal protein S3 n=1 Tax=Heterostelium pallidum TaxID=13642 RepID=Q5ILL0_HETPA|nr:ribosomal protein S3 [Heterostelium pallidum]AAU00600.1 ribosomal protein S3 [Heterostelium pallidum]
MGHVVNPVVLRLGVITPWIAASYSRKNNKRIQYTIENFLVYNYIRKFFNNKIYLKVLSKIRKRKKKYLKNFLFSNFPYIFSHLSIMRITNNYQLNLFFYDTSLQYALNLKNKRFFKKKKQKKKKVTLRIRKRRLNKKRILKKYKKFMTYNSFMFQLNVRNKLKFKKYLYKKFIKELREKFKNKFKYKLRRFNNRFARKYSIYNKYSYSRYTKKNKRINLRLRSYYKKRKDLSIKRIKRIKKRKLLKLKKYLLTNNNNIKFFLLKKIQLNATSNKLSRFDIKGRLLKFYKFKPVIKQIMTLKNKNKSYYYKTRNRSKFRNFSLIKLEYKEYKKTKKNIFSFNFKNKKKDIKIKRKRRIFQTFNGLVTKRRRIKSNHYYIIKNKCKNIKSS